MGKSNLSIEKERTQRELARQTAQVRIAVIERLFELARTAITWAGVVGLAYMCYLTAREFAGQSTSATFSFIAKVAADRWVAYSLSAIFGLGYAYERRARKKLVRSTAPYIKTLEEKVDPNRSSSGLALDGEPPKKSRKSRKAPVE